MNVLHYTQMCIDLWVRLKIAYVLAQLHKPQTQKVSIVFEEKTIFLFEFF